MKFDLFQILRENCRDSLIAVAIFSGIANSLMLVPAFFMLSVYDKAIGSNSMATLGVLSLITVFMFLGMAAMEAIRSRVLLAVSTKLHNVVAPIVYQASYQHALKGGGFAGSPVQPLTDFNQLRQFLSGSGAITVFDTPWMPIYIVVMFLFHPVIGWLGVLSVLIMLALAIGNQKLTASRLAAANAQSRYSMASTASTFANVEAAAAMGMFEPLQKQWAVQTHAVITDQNEASKWAGFFTALTKTFGVAVQSAAIGIGAFLALKQEISPGTLIAGSILAGRALQPIQLAVGSWKGFADAKGQYQRLKELIENTDWNRDQMTLPKIRGGVSAKNASISPPNTQQLTLRNASFEIPPGTICVVMGPSGAGKSTLMRGILGLWPTASGDIRIDGAEAANYDRAELGPQIGYLPQAIELFDGSVSQNIARQGDVNAEAVIMAARDAQVHDFILSLPDGYDTKLGKESGLILSPGQRQRLALARALYGRPKLVVLDEPNSNLDKQGELALNAAIEALRSAGSTVIVVTHREGAIKIADLAVVVSSGAVIDSGPPAEVLARFQEKAELLKSKQLAAKTRNPAVKTIPI